MLGHSLQLSIAASLCILIPPPAMPQQPAAPADSNVVLARRLLQVTHQDETLIAGIDSVISKQRRQNSQLPGVFDDSVLVRMKRSVPEVLDSLAPIYARRLKRSELQELIHFFETPTGQDYATQQPSLSIEAAQFGQRWGEAMTRAARDMSLGRRITEKR